jgi:hypothetical protein
MWAKTISTIGIPAQLSEEVLLFYTGGQWEVGSGQPAFFQLSRWDTLGYDAAGTWMINGNSYSATSDGGIFILVWDNITEKVADSVCIVGKTGELVRSDIFLSEEFRLDIY